MIDQNRVPHRPRQKLIEPQKEAAHEINLVEQGWLFRLDDLHDLPGRDRRRGRCFNEFIVPLDKSPHPITVNRICILAAKVVDTCAGSIKAICMPKGSTSYLSDSTIPVIANLLAE